MSKLTVRLFAAAKEVAGTDRVEIPCPVGGLSRDQVWSGLQQAVPALTALRRTSRLARNQAFASTSERFFPSDEAAVIPPVSGG